MAEPCSIAIMGSLSTMFGVGRGIKAIGEYVGIIESIDTKIDMLMQAELNAAFDAFQSARRSTHKANFYTDIERALGLFEKATKLEHDLRKVLAYLGIAVCYAQREHPEKANTDHYLKELLKVNFSRWKLVRSDTFAVLKQVGGPRVAWLVSNLVMAPVALGALGVVVGTVASITAIRGKPTVKKEIKIQEDDNDKKTDKKKKRMIIMYEYSYMMHIQDAVRSYLTQEQSNRNTTMTSGNKYAL